MSENNRGSRSRGRGRGGSGGGPVISWEPEKLKVEVPPGETERVTVHFEASKALEEVNIRRVPELRDNMIPDKEQFAMVEAGGERSSEISVEIPYDVTTGTTVDGVVQLREGNRQLARPLPVEIEVTDETLAKRLEDDEFSVSPGATELDGPTSAALDEVDYDEHVLEFDDITEQLERLHEGDLFVVGTTDETPNGYAGHIDSIELSNPSAVIRAEPVSGERVVSSLDDALNKLATMTNGGLRYAQEDIRQIARACDEIVETTEEMADDVRAGKMGLLFELVTMRIPVGHFAKRMPDYLHLPVPYDLLARKTFWSEMSASLEWEWDEQRDEPGSKFRPGANEATSLADARNPLETKGGRALYGSDELVEEPDVDAELVMRHYGNLPAFFDAAYRGKPLEEGNGESFFQNRLLGDWRHEDGFYHRAYRGEGGDGPGIEGVFDTVGDEGIEGQYEAAEAAFDGVPVSERSRWISSLEARAEAAAVIRQELEAGAEASRVIAEELDSGSTLSSVFDAIVSALLGTGAAFLAVISPIGFGALTVLAIGTLAGGTYSAWQVWQDKQELNDAEQALFHPLSILLETPSVARRLHLNSGVAHLVEQQVSPRVPNGHVTGYTHSFDSGPDAEGEGQVEIYEESGSAPGDDPSGFRYAGSAVKVRNDGDQAGLFVIHFRYDGELEEVDNGPFGMHSKTYTRIEPGETRTVFAVHNAGDGVVDGRPVSGSNIEVNVLEINEQGTFWVDDFESEWEPNTTVALVDSPPEPSELESSDVFEVDGTFPETAVAEAVMRWESDEKLASFDDGATEHAVRAYLGIANTSQPVVLADFEDAIEDSRGLQIGHVGYGRVDVIRQPDFEDENLEDVVRQKIDVLPDWPIVVDLVAEITNLDAGYERIESLGGLEDLENLVVADLQQNRIDSGAGLLDERFPQLVDINLRGNEIENLSGMQDADLPRLRRLNLKFNEIGNLAGLAGTELPSLERLNLAQNNLSTVSGLADAGLDNLEVLIFRSNDIESLSGFAGALLPELRRLQLDGNAIPDLSGVGQAQLENLERLELENNAIHDVSALEEAELLSLRDLSLQENEVHRLSALVELTAPELRKIRLGNNDVEDLDAFEDFEHPQLRKIGLNNNRIEEVDGLAGASLPALEELNLKGNRLRDVSGLAGAEFGALEELFLQYNGITALEGLTDAELPSLEELYLWENQLEELDDIAGAEFAALRVLSLWDNSIESIEGLVEASVPNLEQLDLWRNEMTTLREMEGAEFPAVEKIKVNENQLADLEGLSEASFPALETLNAARNQIEDLGGLEGAELPNIESLSLQRNHITDIAGLAAADLPSLRSINLTSNSVQDLSTLAEAGLPHLESLGLRNNDIHDIEPLLEIDSVGGTLERIDLRNNPGVDPSQRETFEVVETLQQDGVEVLYDEGAIDFADPQFEELVRQEADLQEGDSIYPADVQGITELDGRSFGIERLEGIEHLVDLEKLNLADNPLEPETLKGLTLPSLRELNLMDVGLDRLDALATGDFQYLESLELSDNAIESVAPLTEQQFPALEVLTISGNELEHLQSLKGADWPYLETLYVEENKLASLDGLADAGLLNLESLHVSDNQLVDIGELARAELQRLEKLRISGNELQDFGDVAGAQFPELDMFVAYNNELSEVSGLDEAYLPNLRNLQLYGNQLEDITGLLELDSLGGALDQVYLHDNVTLDTSEGSEARQVIEELEEKVRIVTWEQQEGASRGDMTATVFDEAGNVVFDAVIPEDEIDFSLLARDVVVHDNHFGGTGHVKHRGLRHADTGEIIAPWEDLDNWEGTLDVYDAEDGTLTHKHSDSWRSTRIHSRMGDGLPTYPEVGDPVTWESKALTTDTGANHLRLYADHDEDNYIELSMSVRSSRFRLAYIEDGDRVIKRDSGDPKTDEWYRFELRLETMEGDAEVRGEVIDEDGQPLDGLDMTAWDPEVEEAIAETSTDHQGTYSVGVPEGHFYIQGEGDVIERGHIRYYRLRSSSAPREVEVSDGDVETVDFAADEGYFLELTDIEFSPGNEGAEVEPGETVTLSFSYQFWNHPGCPDCIVFLPVGVEEKGRDAVSLGIPGTHPGTNGSATIEMTAPTTSGRYIVYTRPALQFTAEDSLESYEENFDPEEKRYLPIGEVVVT